MQADRKFFVGDIVKRKWSKQPDTRRVVQTGQGPRGDEVRLHLVLDGTTVWDEGKLELVERPTPRVENVVHRMMQNHRWK